MGKHSIVGGVSKEDDYLALSIGADSEWELNERRTTLSAGALYSNDQLEPTDGGSERFPNRIVDADKWTVTAYGGVSQTLGPQTIAQLSLSYTYSDGYLSDPYKQVYVVGNILPDSRPDQRSQGAVSLRLRHYFPRMRAALHLDGRTFYDDWGVGADNIELAWYQNFPGDWKVVPSVRWYEQGVADFYRPYFTMGRDDGHYSSDYRLSAYGALSYRIGAMKDWRQWAFSFAFERYDSESGFALREVDQESPGLVDFSVITAALSYRFKLK
jgi:hypothetical protein